MQFSKYKTVLTTLSRSRLNTSEITTAHHNLLSRSHGGHFKKPVSLIPTGWRRITALLFIGSLGSVHQLGVYTQRRERLCISSGIFVFRDPAEPRLFTFELIESLLDR